jgi:hypothetical protein
LKRLGELEERVTEEFYRKEPTMQGMMGEANKGQQVTQVENLLKMQDRR